MFAGVQRSRISTNQHLTMKAPQYTRGSTRGEDERWEGRVRGGGATYLRAWVLPAPNVYDGSVGWLDIGYHDNNYSRVC